MARPPVSPSGATTWPTSGAKRSRPTPTEAKIPYLAQLLAELLRLTWLTAVEEGLARGGSGPVAGVDEAGRGCLAGPVVAAAVIPDPRCRIPGVDDSKDLSPELRRILAERIRGTALSWSVAAVAARTIDGENILRATRRAMCQALAGLRLRPRVAIVDAVALPDAGLPCLALVKGDRLSYAVASASILAKTERDALMVELDRRYPHYGFARHKGYASASHRQALAEFGPSPEHRLSFRGVVPR